ncbi:terminase small subunit [Ralstonia phage RS-PII-1]|uniref:DNA maturase A n=1 Tax=Ralstonia phage RS-PII-1 TaxID=1932892 RepID=A0A1L7DQF8_9CAUD|nr:terminase small subunit [Ralstonia phage RS-PII-1]APU00295.1 hypothetical protein [Ralstonia phage RS-PII-1]
MSKASTTLLEQLHAAVAEELLTRVKNGEATAADLGAAIKMLKDNSITAVIEDNAAMSELQAKIEARRAKRKATQPEVHSGPLTADELSDAVDNFHVH